MAPLEQVRHRLGDQLDLGREVMELGASGDPGLTGDPGRGGMGVAVLFQALQGRIEERRAGGRTPLLLRPPDAGNPPGSPHPLAHGRPHEPQASPAPTNSQACL
jgi:hypothetical protein